MKINRLLTPAVKRNIQKIIILPHYFVKKYISGRPLALRWDSSDVNVYYHTLVQKEYDFPFTL